MQTTALVLGLDIGVASVGWALVDLQARQIQAAGVRIFDAAMDSVKFEAGDQGASHAATRRAARLQRRHLRRRAARHRDLYLALQGAGLLPFAGLKAENRHEILTKLDRELMENWRPRILEQTPDIIEPDQILCYYLRACALDHKLQPCELGRAIYHLGQRRGFKSNRREGRATVTASAPASSEREHSEIKTSINTLAERLNADHLTLGQYLTKVNPHTSAIRNRKRPDIPPIWTGRAMYQEEFNRIWAAQAHYHPGILTEALRNSLNRLLFWQRGISAGKPGHCELEPNLDRAPKSSLLAQQFRMVQAVNNLKVCERGGIERKLRADERRVLTAILGTVITELKGKKRKSELFGLRFSTVKQSLGLHAHAKLNLDDEQADSYLRGNRTKAVMVRAFGQERWDALDDSQQRRIVRRWIKEQSPEKLLAIAGAVWKLEPHAAARLAETEPEEGYAALSHVAILKLLPAMEQEGLTYSEAVAKVYGNIFSGQTPKDNDISDILLCWTNAKDLEFNHQRAQRLSKLKKEIAPLKSERLDMHKAINRLKYERTVATVDSADLRLELEADEKRLSKLSAKIAPFQNEINQLSRQFSVSKEQIKANQYRLSASLYRQIEQDEPFYEKPGTTIQRLMRLEQIAMESTAALKEMVK